MWISYGVVLAVLSCICFGNVTSHLLDTHDDQTFRDNIAVSENFWFFFSTEKEHPSGRPVAELVKWIAYLQWGNDPFWFHFLVIITHTLASYLVSRTAYNLGVPIEISFAGGLLFLSNVAHFQAVHHISALDYPLALTIGLMALQCYLRFLDNRKHTWLLLFYIAMASACLSHFSSAFLLPFCFCLAWNRGQDIKSILTHIVPLGFVLLVTLVLVLAITTEAAATWVSIRLYEEANTFSLLNGWIRVFLWFLSRLLTTSHGIWTTVYTMQTWELYLGGLLLLAIAVVMWKARGLVALWCIWTLLSLAPFVLLTEQAIADLPAGPSRYLYPASAGSSLLIAWGLRQISLCAKGAGNALFAAGMVLLLISSFAGLRKAEALSLYTSGRFYAALGDDELCIDRFKLAIDRGSDVINLEDTYTRLLMQLLGSQQKFSPILDEALQQFPESWSLNTYRLVILAVQGNTDADQRLKNIAASSGNRLDRELISSAFRNLGIRHYEQKDFDTAAKAFRLSLHHRSTQRTHQSLALTLFKLGEIRQGEQEWEAAIDAYRESLDASPEFPAVHAKLGVLLRSLNRNKEAVAVYEMALRHFDMPVFYHNMAAAKLTDGDVKGAIDAYTLAIAMGIDFIHSYLILGQLYEASGHNAEKQVDLYRRVLQSDLKGDSDEIYMDLGSRLERLGYAADAAIAYRKALDKNPTHQDADDALKHIQASKNK